jgi:hypothetical protein
LFENRNIVEQDRKCAICHEEFTDYNDVVSDHEDPRGMGGAWRDDRPDNIRATHWCCQTRSVQMCVPRNDQLINRHFAPHW